MCVKSDAKPNSIIHSILNALISHDGISVAEYACSYILSVKLPNKYSTYILTKCIYNLQIQRNILKIKYRCNTAPVTYAWTALYHEADSMQNYANYTTFWVTLTNNFTNAVDNIILTIHNSLSLPVPSQRLPVSRILSTRDSLPILRLTPHSHNHLPFLLSYTGFCFSSFLTLLLLVQCSRLSSFILSALQIISIVPYEQTQHLHIAQFTHLVGKT